MPLPVIIDGVFKNRSNGAGRIESSQAQEDIRPVPFVRVVLLRDRAARGSMNISGVGSVGTGTLGARILDNFIAIFGWSRNSS